MAKYINEETRIRLEDLYRYVNTFGRLQSPSVDVDAAIAEIPKILQIEK